MENQSPRKNRRGRSHSHAVKLGNGNKSKAGKKLVYVRGVLLNGKPCYVTS